MEIHEDKPSFVCKDYSPFKGEFVRILSGGILADTDLINVPGVVYPEPKN